MSKRQGWMDGPSTRQYLVRMAVAWWVLIMTVCAVMLTSPITYGHTVVFKP